MKKVSFLKKGSLVIWDETLMSSHPNLIGVVLDHDYQVINPKFTMLEVFYPKIQQKVFHAHMLKERNLPIGIKPIFQPKE